MTDVVNPRICAAFDIGTNSVKLLVADLADGVRMLYEETIVTRLGAGMLPNNPRLWESPMHRTIEALRSLAAKATELGAEERTSAVGTAALREAANRDEFVRRLRDACGLNVRVISGEEEARLSFMAVMLDPQWRNRGALMVIDIGGGSTEIITGTVGASAPLQRTSVPMGAVKLTERFIHADPPAVKELAAATTAVNNAFSEVNLPSPGDFTVVGVGGTVTNVAAIARGRFCAPDELHGTVVSQEQIEQVMQLLEGCGLDERKTLPGLDPRRADIIVGGVILLNMALGSTGYGKLEVSTRGLRWGVLYDSFLN